MSSKHAPISNKHAVPAVEQMLDIEVYPAEDVSGRTN